MFFNFHFYRLKIYHIKDRKYLKPLIFLSDPVFEVPIRTLKVRGISTTLKLFSINNMVVNNANRPLLKLTTTWSVSGYVNLSITASRDSFENILQVLAHLQKQLRIIKTCTEILCGCRFLIQHLIIFMIITNCTFCRNHVRLISSPKNKPDKIQPISKTPNFFT